MPKPRILARVSALEEQSETLEACLDLGEVSGEISLDPVGGRIFSATVTGALTVGITEAAPGQTLLLVLSNGGSHAVTWGMSPRWPGGQAPVLSSRDLIALTCCPDGIWDGVLVSADAQ